MNNLADNEGSTDSTILNANEKYSLTSPQSPDRLSDAKEFIIQLFCAFGCDNRNGSNLRMRVCDDDDLSTIKHWKPQCFKGHSIKYETNSSQFKLTLDDQNDDERKNELRVVPSQKKSKNEFWNRIIRISHVLQLPKLFRLCRIFTIQPLKLDVILVSIILFLVTRTMFIR